MTTVYERLYKHITLYITWNWNFWIIIQMLIWDVTRDREKFRFIQYDSDPEYI